MTKGKCGVAMVIWILVIIGAINWGITGLGGFFNSNWNLVNLLLGSFGWWVEGTVYVLVGIAGVMSIFHCKCGKCNSCEACGTDNMKKEVPMQQM
jgi:uncharacterized membrane protein YuzA (DUF378 family)